MPLSRKPLDVGAVRHVGALHRVAEVGQDLGDAAHADAADADEVDRADIACGSFIGIPPSRVCPGKVDIGFPRRTRAKIKDSSVREPGDP